MKLMYTIVFLWYLFFNNYNKITNLLFIFEEEKKSKQKKKKQEI